MTARPSRSSAPAESPSRVAPSDSLEQSLQAAREALERLRITLGPLPRSRERSAGSTGTDGKVAGLCDI